MYGYGRAYRSRMGCGQLFTSKICKKSNFEDKNIEKYVLFRRTISLLWEKKYIYIYIYIYI
jgi:hypothetical protein